VAPIDTGKNIMERSLTWREIDTFNADGVALLRNAVDDSWIERLNAVVDRQLSNPGKWSNDPSPGAARNRNFTDRYLWKENPEINSFVHESGCARLAAQAMRSKSVRFYFDHLLVKEPGTTTPTPWHQDISYWPFLGKQICSIWLALTPCDVESSSLEFVRGSHLDDKYYMAEAFNGEDDENAVWMAKGQGEKCPDIEADRPSFDIVGFDVAPGDALIFSAWTIHGAKGNADSEIRRAALSTRWLGDDSVWHPRPSADPTVQQADVSVAPGQAPHDDETFPEIWRA